MSDDFDRDYGGLERGGACNNCGEQVEEEHHAYCPACFAIEMGWEDDDECDACGRALVEVRGRLVCPNPYCTSRGAA